MAAPFELSIDQRDIQRVAAALKSEVDGKELRRELIRDMRAVTAPVIVDLKAVINAAPAATSAAPPLRPAIAAGIVAAVRLSGQSTGVGIRAKTTPGIRDFRKAAKAFNRPSWRHKVYGRNTWVTQVGKPRWFDDTTDGHRAGFQDAVMASVESMARRIAARARR